MNTLVVESISSFLQGLGMDLTASRLGEDDENIHISLANLGDLHIERCQDQLIVALVRGVENHAVEETLQCFLENLYDIRNGPYPLQVGLRGDRHLVVAFQLPLTQVSGPILRAAVDEVVDFFQKANSSYAGEGGF
jgi:type III secretion system chaperone SycN